MKIMLVNGDVGALTAFPSSDLEEALILIHTDEVGSLILLCQAP